MDDSELPSYETALAVEQNEQKACGDKACEFDSDSITTPSAPPLPINEEPENIFSKLTDEEIREVCFRYAEKNFGKAASAVKEMKIKNVHRTCSFHYKLETFTERRQVTTGHSHYYKQIIDGPKNGPEPDIWCITAEPPSHFQDYNEPIIIPHSEQVKTCHQCDGRGKEDCLICEGAGWTYCKICSPTSENSCTYCRSGRVSCDPCNKTGRIKCRICEGYKKLKHYKELKVSWQTHIDHFVQNSTKIPDSLLQNSACKEIFREERQTVHPIENFSRLFIIKEASLHLIEKHEKILSKGEVIRMQRQTLRAVPITRVNCEYNDEENEFYVFGLENSVHFTNSLSKPSSCCIS